MSWVSDLNESEIVTIRHYESVMFISLVYMSVKNIVYHWILHSYIDINSTYLCALMVIYEYETKLSFEVV